MSERLVELLDPKPGEAILDLAAGFGDTGFLAAPRLQPGGRLVTTDAAPEMVDAARRRAAEVGLDAEVSFEIEDAADLSFPSESFDGVLCRWGLMLVPEMRTAAAEMARVLRPGGRASVAVWADPEANDWITAAGRSAVELGFMERPDPDAPGPFRLAADGALQELLESAGLAVAAVEEIPLVWRAASLDEWWEVIRDTSRVLSDLLGRIGDDEAAAVRAGAERRLERYVAADGSVAVPSLARLALAVR